MTNEEHLEEILVESYNLGFHKEIFEIVKKKYNQLEMSNAFSIALNELKEKYKDDNKEI